VDQERGPVEVVRDVVSGASDGFWFLFAFGVSVALVVMGNTLARLIGVALLAIWLYIASRLLRKWLAS
jgi:short subunit fatty acids transporter